MSRTPSTGIPRPGSSAAKKLGCTCSRDINDGRQMQSERQGVTRWAIHWNCEVHNVHVKIGHERFVTQMTPAEDRDWLDGFEIQE